MLNTIIWISASVILAVILFYYTPLRYLVLYNILGRIAIRYYHYFSFPIKKACRMIGMKKYPVINKKLLKKYGLNKITPIFEMFVWYDMDYSYIVPEDKRKICVKNGMHIYVVADKTIWGRSNFLDPDDPIRYQLWDGSYIIPLEQVYEKNGEELLPIKKFGYDAQKNDINFEDILLLIQYDIYVHWFYFSDHIPEDVRENIKEIFQIKNVEIHKKTYNEAENYWQYEASTEGRSVMFYSDSWKFKSFSSFNHFGWAKKTDEENYAKTVLKGNLIISFLNRNGERVHPGAEDALYLSVGYAFGQKWKNGEMETPAYLMKEISDSYIDLQYKSM